MKGYLPTMKKKRRKVIHRMNKLLILVMGMLKDEDPVTVCSVCCAVVMIIYKRMDDEGREAISPVILECFTVIAEDQKKMQVGEQVH